MMDVMIQKLPSEAEEMIDQLEAIKWHQYLTPKEAERIVLNMDPKAPWSRDTWKSAMTSFGLPLEEAPFYNRCALWVEMNKIYSDFGDEIAALLGITLKENFRYPYQSLNLQEFWRRWHISLSTWFRDYVYIPLGGNRKGTKRTYFNHFVTMLVAGLWHGSSWMFVIWGALHGIGGVVHKFCKQWLDLIPNHWYVRFIS